MTKKNLLQFVCLIMFLFIGRTILLYLIEPVDYSIYFNRIIRNKAEANNNHIDLVFIGDSRPHRAFDPAVFEKELEISSAFNASSGLQPIEASYYLLKDISERYSVKYAVLGITSGTFFKNESTVAKVIVLDRLHGLNKLRFLLSNFTTDEYLNAVSLCYRFRNNFTLSNIRDNLLEKRELRKNHYTERKSGPDLYTDSGFIYSYQTGEIGNAADSRYNLKRVSPIKIEYFQKIVSLCEEKGIRLFLVTPPWSIMNIYQAENYQDLTDYFKETAAEYDLSYVNLNYLRGREEWLGDQMMFDSGHVNGEGAELVSEKYAQILKSELEDKEIPDMFYKNLAELKADVHRIFAIGADIWTENFISEIRINSRQSEEIKPLFRVLISIDGENYSPVSDWSDKTEISINVSSYSGSVYYMIESKTRTGDPGPYVTYRKAVQ